MKNLSKFFMFMLMVFVAMSTGRLNVNGQQYKPGPQDLCFFSSVDETDQPYAIYIPENFDESKKYPLVIFLHGAISNHRLGLRRVFGVGNIQGPEFGTPGFVPPQTDLEATRYYPELKSVDYIVAAPYARGTAGYQGIPEQDLYEMLDDIKSRFSIDEDRIYLTGLSMGGGGTLWNGLTRPDIWAAIAPCCPAPPGGTEELVANALNIPVHLFIGDRDGGYERTQQWRNMFEDNQVKCEYIEYPGIGHNSWEYAYKDGFIFEWFSQFKRDLFPGKVVFSTKWFKYNKAYWVKIDKLAPGTLASMTAAYTGKNSIEVSTKELEAFTLNLEGHPQFNASDRLQVVVDGTTLTLRTPDVASFIKVNGSWKKGKFTPGLNSKKPGSEGPLSAAIASNHVYVYGTQGDPSPEELETRRAQAAEAANWSADRGMMGRIMVFPRVISDQQIRQSDLETSNLILFGTKETNSIIAKYCERLPMHMKEETSDYGLVYVFPMNDHYVLVNSGLAWWTPPAETAQRRMAFSTSVSIALDNYEDFILFKGTPDNIISEGYFNENWKIPADKAAELRSSGVVEIIE